MELSAGVAPRFLTNRKLEHGKEIVDIPYLDGWYKGLEYVINSDETEVQEEYKGILAEDAGYPVEDWWRVVDVEPAEVFPNGVKLRVTLLSPGKCVEEGLEVTPDEWETFKLTRDKSKNGRERTEIQLEQLEAQGT